MENQNLESIKKQLVETISKKLEDKIIEPSNAELIVKLINNAETVKEAVNIAALGTTYKKTGFHFDKRLDKIINNGRIKYFKKNEELSFSDGSDKPINKLIIGDNFDALQNLLIQYKGSIDVIYIDPPYGKDSMGQFAETNYNNAITRDNLLSLLYNRLMIAKELLSDEGTIFCSIDDKNQAYVKGLFDEVFFEKGYITTIPRVTKNQRSGQEKYMDISHDYVLVYSYRGDFKHIINRDIDENKIKVNSIGKYIEGDTKAILAAKSQGYSKGGDYDYEFNGKIFKPIDSKGKRNRWLWTKERMDAAKELGILVETKNSLREQLFVDMKFDDKTNSMVPKDTKLIFHTSDFMILDKYTNSNGDSMLQSILNERIFGNPKPVELIKDLINLIDDKNSIVLDFFAGSGTTGQAVLELNNQDGGNRQFILCQLNEITDTTPNGIVKDVTSKRLKRVMTGECYDGNKKFDWIKKNDPLGGSLDVYEIANDLANNESTEGQTAFDVIDETLYGKEKFTNLQDKIEWVCTNFENCQKELKE